MIKRVLFVLCCFFLILPSLSAHNVEDWDKKVMAIYNDSQLSNHDKIVSIAEITYDYCASYLIMNEEVAIHYSNLLQPLLPDDVSADLNVLIYRPMLFLSADAESERLFYDKFISYIKNSTDPRIRFEGWLILGQLGIYSSDALEYLFNALAEVKGAEHKKEQSIVYQYISYYYSIYHNRDYQLKYALLSVDAAEKSKDTRQMISSWKDLGMAYFEDTGNSTPELALDAYNRARVLFEDEVKIQRSDIRSVESLEYMELLVALGTIYRSMNEQRTAIEYLLKALKIAGANSRAETEAFCHKEIAILHQSLGDPVNAERHLLIAKDMLTNNPAVTKEGMHIDYEIKLNLASLYRETGQYQASADCYKSGIDLYVQMFDQELMDENLRTASYFEAKKRKEDISGLEMIVKLKEKQKYFSLAIAVTLVLILFIVWYLYKLKVTVAKQDARQAEDQAKLLELEMSKARLQAHLKQKEADQLQLQLSAGNELIEHKNDVLAGLKEFIATHPELKEYKNQIEGILMQHNRIESNVDEIKTGLKDVPIDFYVRLQKHACNKLTPLDLKYCRLIYLKTPTKEMASILYVTPSTVRMNKYRIKSKLNLHINDDLYEFIDNIISRKDENAQ